MAATGSAFALGAFEAAIQADTDVTGVLYTGSLGGGTADRYSDLDIELWVTDSAYTRAPNLLQRVMRYLGTVQFMYDRREETPLNTAFVGPDWQRVDLGVHRWGERVDMLDHETARIVKDTDGSLARMVAQVPRQHVRASRDQARASIEEAIDSQIYASLHNARGAVWSAMGEITSRCAALYTLLVLLRGRQSFGFRHVEHLLSPEERQSLEAAWPGGPDREEVRRAIRALWTWTSYVWRDAERELGCSLEIQVDETALLAAVERIYT